MPRSYLRYRDAGVVGVVNSQHRAPYARLVTLGHDFEREELLVLSPALEDVVLWNMRLQIQVAILQSGVSEGPEVSSIASDALGTMVGVGYVDGSIRVYRIPSSIRSFRGASHKGEVTILSPEHTFEGHTSSISVLRFDTFSRLQDETRLNDSHLAYVPRPPSLLLSGSMDTNLIVWDLIGAQAVCTLRGHRDVITDAQFLCGEEYDEPAHVISTSRDTLVKVWDIVVGDCVDTIVGIRCPVLCCAVNPVQTRLLVGASDSMLRMYDISDFSHKQSSPLSLDGASERISSVSSARLQTRYMGEISRAGGKEQICGVEWVSFPASSSISSLGTTPKKKSKKSQPGIGLQPAYHYVLLHGGDRTVEVLPVNSEERIRKRIRKRLQKHKRTSSELADAPALDDESFQNLPICTDELNPSVVLFRAPSKIKSICCVQPYLASLAPFYRHSVYLDESFVVSKKNSDFSYANGQSRQSRRRTDQILSSPDGAIALKHFDMILGLGNNGLQCVRCDLIMHDSDSSAASQAVFASAPDLPSLAPRRPSDLSHVGYSSDVRAVAVSHNDQLVAAVCSDSLKIWSLSSIAVAAQRNLEFVNASIPILSTDRTFIRSLDCGYGVSVAFLPGDRLIAVGCKDGALELYDLASSEQVVRIEAHTGAIWSVVCPPDRPGLVTGGADQCVRFWEIVVEEKDSDTSSTSASPGVDKKFQKQRQISLQLRHTLEMSDAVMSLRFTPDSKLFLVALLDCTVKVFYADSLRFFVSLYGHQMPVLGMDISSDSTLCVTASADKTIKIWGLDFGDCHRTLLGHSESVLSVAFVPETHLFFSVSKDGMLSYWDADSFERITSSRSAFSDCWCVVSSRRGDFSVVGSHDRGLRFFVRTKEQVFLSEEREREREREAEKAAAREKSLAGTLAVDLGDDPIHSVHQRVETIKAGESLLEALEIAEKDDLEVQEYIKSETSRERARELFTAAMQQLSGEKDTDLDEAIERKRKSKDMSKNREESEENKAAPARPPLNPFMLAAGVSTAEEYVLRAVKKIRSSELESALSTLPFHRAVQCALALYKQVLHVESGNGGILDVEICCRVVMTVLRLHHTQIVASRSLSHCLESMSSRMRELLRSMRSIYSFNSAGFTFLSQDLRSRSSMSFIDVTGDKGGDQGGFIGESALQSGKEPRRKRAKYLSDEAKLRSSSSLEEEDGTDGKEE